MEKENKNTNFTDFTKESSSIEKCGSDSQIDIMKSTKTNNNINIEISNKSLMDLLLKNESTIIL